VHKRRQKQIKTVSLAMPIRELILESLKIFKARTQEVVWNPRLCFMSTGEKKTMPV